jgi:hypothetical protein
MIAKARDGAGRISAALQRGEVTAATPAFAAARRPG